MKTLQDPEGKFAAVIEPVATAHGCRLTHVRMGGSQAGAGNALEIFLERLDGNPLTMDDCTKISREAAAILDVEDTVQGAYRLEVGSPGLDRHLTSHEDFVRFAGFEAKLEFKRSMSDGQKKMRGVIVAATDTGFSFTDDQQRNFEFELADLSSARLIATDAVIDMVKKGTFPKPITITQNQALEA